MTIFFKAVLAVIVDEITKQKARAKDADKSYLSFTRNTDISDAKCSHLDAFLGELAKVKNGATDEKTRVELEALIVRYLDSIVNVRVNKEGETYPEGTSEHTLKCLAASLPFVYHNLERLPLVNTPYDNDALSQFRYFVALYHTKKIVKEHLSSVTVGKRLAVVREFIQAQEGIVQAALIECTGYIGTLEAMARSCPRIIQDAATSKYPYEGLRANIVLSQISTLRTQLAALSEKYYKTTLIFDLDITILEDCLMLADREIRKSHISAPGRVRSASIDSNASHASTTRVNVRGHEPDDLDTLELEAAADVQQVQEEDDEPVLERSVSLTAKESAPPPDVSSPTQSTQLIFAKLGQDAPALAASGESKKQAAPAPEVLTAAPASASATLSKKQKRELAAQQAREREGVASTTFSA